jgi:hypothetical protein
MDELCTATESLCVHKRRMWLARRLVRRAAADGAHTTLRHRKPILEKIQKHSRSKIGAPAANGTGDSSGRVSATLYAAVFLDCAAALALDVRVADFTEVRVFSKREDALKHARMALLRRTPSAPKDASLAALRALAAGDADAAVLEVAPAHRAGYRLDRVREASARVVVFLKADLEGASPLDGARACWVPWELDVRSSDEFGHACDFIDKVSADLVGGALFADHLRYACLSGHLGWCFRPAHMTDEEAPEGTPLAPAGSVPKEGYVALRDIHKNWDSLQMILRSMREVYLDPSLRLDLFVRERRVSAKVVAAAERAAEAERLSRTAPEAVAVVRRDTPFALPPPLLYEDTPESRASLVSTESLPALDLLCDDDLGSSEYASSQESEWAELSSSSETPPAASIDTVGLCDALFRGDVSRGGTGDATVLAMLGYSCTPRASPVAMVDEPRSKSPWLGAAPGDELAMMMPTAIE